MDQGKMWVNPEAWNKIESERKAKEEAEKHAEQSQEGGFMGFSRENAEFEEQIAKSDVARGVFNVDDDVAEILASQGSLSRQEWEKSRGPSTAPVRRPASQGLGPGGSSFGTPSVEEMDRVRKAEEFIKQHGSGDGAAAHLAKLLEKMTDGPDPTRR